MVNQSEFETVLPDFVLIRGRRISEIFYFILARKAGFVRVDFIRKECLQRKIGRAEGKPEFENTAVRIFRLKFFFM